MKTTNLDHVRELAAKDPRYARLLPRVRTDKATPGGRVELPCVYRGDEVSRPGPKRYFECDHPAKPLGSPVCSCQGCGPRCPKFTPDLVRPGDVPAGVVIGSYKWPSVVELNVKLVRAKCGDVPVLVVNDSCPRTEEVEAVCSRVGADFRRTPGRIGHTGGDLAAFNYGLEWAAGKGLKVLAKLSQRFLALRPRWLQDGAEQLLASGLPLATQKTVGRRVFPLRTEACLLDVAAWHPVRDELIPAKTYGPRTNAETVMREALDELGGVYWPWDIMGEVREHNEPDIVWHWFDAREQYEKLAAQYGVTLEDDFHTAGWEGDRERGEYKYG